MDIKIDVSGNMDVPESAKHENFGGQKSQLNFSNLSNTFAKFPGSIVQLIAQLRQNIRPVSEFFNTQNFKTIASVPRLTNRLTRNVVYFQSNYLCIVLILMIYCLITSPLILIVLCGVLYGCHRIRQMQINFTVFGKNLSTSQQCLIVNCMAAPVLYLVGAGAALFWTLGASLFVISLHAGFYNIDAIVTEDTEGFLSEIV